MKAVTQDTLDVALADFKKYSEKCVRRIEPEQREKLFHDGSVGRHSGNLLYENGLIWWGGVEGHDHQPIASPTDYTEIRDERRGVEDFVERILDRGKIYFGTSYWNQDGETNTAEYVAWLYRNCEYTPFKRNLEEAVISLLKREMGRDFPVPDYEEGMIEARQRFDRLYRGQPNCLGNLFSTDNLQGALWRAGLENPQTREDKEMADRFNQELTKTLREITHGARYQAVHFSKASPRFKKDFTEWHLHKEARKNAEEKWSPTLNLAVGLLEVVAKVGRHDNAFQELGDILEEKAREKWMYHAPNVQLGWGIYPVNSYNTLLTALGKVQSGSQLDGFWLAGIEEDPNLHGVFAAIHGYLSSYSTRGLPPPISTVLKSVKKRGEKTLEDEARVATNDRLNGFTLLTVLGNHLAHYTNHKELGFIHDLNPKRLIFSGVKDVKKDEEGNYHFQWERFTTRGQAAVQTRYNPTTEKYVGLARLRESTTRYIDYLNGTLFAEKQSPNQIEIEEIDEED